MSRSRSAGPGTSALWLRNSFSSPGPLALTWGLGGTYGQGHKRGHPGEWLQSGIGEVIAGVRADITGVVIEGRGPSQQQHVSPLLTYPPWFPKTLVLAPTCLTALPNSPGANLMQAHLNPLRYWTSAKGKQSETTLPIPSQQCLVGAKFQH